MSYHFSAQKKNLVVRLWIQSFCIPMPATLTVFISAFILQNDLQQRWTTCCLATTIIIMPYSTEKWLLPFDIVVRAILYHFRLLYKAKSSTYFSWTQEHLVFNLCQLLSYCLALFIHLCLEISLTIRMLWSIF